MLKEKQLRCPRSAAAPRWVALRWPGIAVGLISSTALVHHLISPPTDVGRMPTSHQSVEPLVGLIGTSSEHLGSVPIARMNLLIAVFLSIRGMCLREAGRLPE